MAEPDKAQIPIDRFVDLMNGELCQYPGYQDGMQFVTLEGGYDFVAPMLTIMENLAFANSVFDRIGMKYTISR